MSSPDVLGRLASLGAGRDAVHVAIIPVVCEEEVEPGQPLKIEDGKVVKSEHFGRVGIVDPFLDRPVDPLKSFYMLLNPGSITSLKHVWTHPAFGDEVEAIDDENMRFFREIAATCSMNVQKLLDAASDYAESGEYTYMGNNENYTDVTAREWEEFWRRWKVHTGKEAVYKDFYDRGSFFSCSC